MNQKDEITKFARNILGCGCENEVFEHIEVESDKNNLPVMHIDKRINIGNRLLIYIVKDGVFLSREQFEILLQGGKKDRDENGFNRFRLVIASNNAGNDSFIYNGYFNALQNLIDEKIHLHILDRENVKNLYD